MPSVEEYVDEGLNIPPRDRIGEHVFLPRGESDQECESYKGQETGLGLCRASQIVIASSGPNLAHGPA